MDPIGDDPTEQSSGEANDLLEDCWFFDNLLNRKQRMQRCFSDPHSNSSNFGDQEMSVKKDFTQGNIGFAGPNLVRTPSLPSGNKSMKKLTRQTSHQKVLQTTTKPPAFMSRTAEKFEEYRESDVRRSKVNGQPVRHTLLRTPSLPPSMRREEKYQESVPLRPKGLMTQSSSIPRSRPPEDTDGGRLPTRLSTRKSLSDLEIEELQGFKDLGFTFDKKEELSPSVVNILPGLQQKKVTQNSNPEQVRRPYLSEAWLVQSCALPTPDLGASRSAEDMKAQIKFWARAVASNVR